MTWLGSIRDEPATARQVTVGTELGETIGMTRSTLAITTACTLLACALMLDTWRPGAFHLRAALVVSAVLLALGLFGIWLETVRRSAAAQGSKTSVQILATGALAGVLLMSLLGFAILQRKGYSANVGQFVRIREQQPFGVAQFDRAADGAILMTMTHGSGVAVERTMFPLDVTPNVEQLAAAAQFVERTRTAAAQFADFDRAQKEQGFSIAAAALEGDDSPTIEHLVSPANMMDDKLLDPDHPESLVFQYLPSGEKRLVAIMYMTRPGQHGTQFGGPLTRWHWHPSAPSCIDSFGVIRVRKSASGSCPAGLSGGPTSEMLHVWLVDHSYGVFSHLMGSPGQAPPDPKAAHQMHH